VRICQFRHGAKMSEKLAAESLLVRCTEAGTHEMQALET
jgi:hypothetical protein